MTERKQTDPTQWDLTIPFTSLDRETGGLGRIMTRPLLLAFLIPLLSGCASFGPVPDAYRPTVYGGAVLGTVAVTGNFGAVDDAARSVMNAPFGDRVTRPETWIQHATVPVLACGFASLVEWTWDACAPAAAGSVLFFAVKEAKEWGHPHFSPTDGIMDFTMPALTGAMVVRVVGWPEWECP